MADHTAYFLDNLSNVYILKVVIKYLKIINSIQKFQTKSVLFGAKSTVSISEPSFFKD